MAKPVFALLNLGFRPFFFGGAIFSIVSVLIWMGIFTNAVQADLNGLPGSLWHGHEMIFGYAMAVVAGFLLTAAKTWTGIQTLHGRALLVLLLLWLVARLVPFADPLLPLEIMAGADCLFNLLLLVSIAVPIVRAGQWRQAMIIGILSLLLGANLSFYYGVIIGQYVTAYRAVYCALYLIIVMITLMGGRVIPFFTARGVGYSRPLTPRPWLESLCFAGIVVFASLDVFSHTSRVTGLTAGIACLAHGIRLAGWYTSAIWHEPLLWILFLAYACVVLGLGLQAVAALVAIPPFIALHAFAYGGIGLMTLGMICRIVWGHTGRDISRPPRSLQWIFLPIVFGLLARVILPLVAMQYYSLWIATAQVLWILSFAGFLFVYTPLLFGPRPDGKFG